MATSLTLAIGALALLVFVLLGVVTELYRDVRQLREVTGILDRPLDVDLANIAGTWPSEHGLPSTLDTAASAIVLFLSDRCATCHALASGLGGALPAGLWVVLEARGPDAAASFLDRYRFTPASTDGRLCVDVDSAIADRIGLRTTPVGFRVRNGRIVAATTVPSSRYLGSLLPNRVRLERPDSSPVPERMTL